MSVKYGSGVLDGSEVVGATLADDDMPCLCLSYNGAYERGYLNNQITGAKVSIDANGSDASTLRIVVTKSTANFGTAGSDLTYTIDGGASKVAWSGALSASATATASTMEELIDLLNEIDGVEANILHAPWDMSVNSDDFIDLAEQAIPYRGGVGVSRLECLYRDVSDFVINTDEEVMYMRIGMGNDIWHRQPMALLNVNGTATGDTSGTVKLYVDNVEDAGTTKKLLVNKAIVEAQTEYLGRTREDYMATKGSLILEVAASDLTAATFWVEKMQLSAR